MKTNQIMKAVAVVTTLGVFLAGCSGGANTPTKSNSTPTTNTSSTIPPASGSGPTVGGGGTVTVGGNAITDDIRAAQIAQDMKLNEILAASKAAESAAHSAKSKSNWAMWLGVGAVGLLAGGAILNGIRESKSEEGHFFAGLTGSRRGQTSEVAKAKANEAVASVNKNTDQRATEVKGDVGAVKTEVKSFRASTDKQFGQVGADMATLKKAAAFNIVATIGAIKAAAAAGAKVDQVLKGQDEMAANEAVIKANTIAIKASQTKSAADIDTMKGQLSSAEEARVKLVENIDSILANTKDPVTKKYFDDYKLDLNKAMSEASESVAKAIANNKMVVPPSASKEEIAQAVVGAMPMQQPPQVFFVPAGSTIGAPARGKTEEDKTKEHSNFIQALPEAQAK